MAKKNLSEDEIKYIVTAETAKAQKEIHELSKANKELETSNRQRLNRMIELEAQGKKNTKEYQKLNKVYNEERKKINDNNKTIAERTRQLDVNAMSMVQLRKQAKDLRRELDNVAQALEPERYAELEAELAKVNGRMTELKAKVGEVKQEAQGFSFKDWFLGTAVSRVLVDSLQQAATWFRNVAAEGIEAAQAADGVTRAFRQLDDGHILDNLRKATKGTVTDLDLMKAAVQANDFRIPLQDLGKYLQFAQLKAQQTGQSVDYMTNSIVTGLGRKSVMILDNLGLSAAEINEQIKQGAEFTQAVANIVDKQLAAAGESYVSAADRASKAAVDLKNKQLELGQALLPVKERFDEVYNFGVSHLMDLAIWVVKNRDVIGPLSAAVLAYVVAMKAAAAVSALHVKSLIQEKVQMLTNINVTKAATTAVKAFNASLKANLIGLFVSALASAATYFVLFRKSSSQATDSLKDMNAELMNEQRALSDTFDALKKAGKGTDERRRLIEEVNSKYGQYLPNLLTEKSSLDDIEKAYRNVNAAMVDNIALKYKEQEIDNATTDAAKEQTDALESLRQRMLGRGISKEMALDALKDIKTMTEGYHNAGYDIEKSIGSVIDTVRRKYFGNESIGRAATNDIRDYVNSYRQMKQDIKAIDDKYAVWQQSSATSGATATPTTPTTPTEDKKETIKKQVVDEQKAKQEALQKALEEENALYHGQQMRLREMYLSQNVLNLQTKDEYDEQLQQLEQAHLERMLEIAGPNADPRPQIDAQLLDFKIKVLNEEKAHQDEANEKQKADQERLEKETKASNERITEKQQEEYKKRIATYKNYGQQLGTLMGNVISGQEDLLSAFTDTAIDMVFEVLEKVIEAEIIKATATATASVASATAESFATPDSVLTFGASGAARAAVLTALIMGALAAAKATLKGLVKGSKSSSSSSSSSSSKVTRSTVTATGRESGGKIDVRRRQDGRLFPDADYDPSRRGFIDRPTVIVGDGPVGRSKEWVASNAAVSNPTVAPLLEYLDKAQQAGTIRTLDLNRVIRARLAGFSAGGYVDTSSSGRPTLSRPQSSGRDYSFDRLADAIETLNRNGIRSSVVLTDLERKQQLRQRSREIASK